MITKTGYCYGNWEKRFIGIKDIMSDVLFEIKELGHTIKDISRVDLRRDENEIATVSMYIGDNTIINDISDLEDILFTTFVENSGVLSVEWDRDISELKEKLPDKFIISGVQAPLCDGLPGVRHI